MAVRWQGPGGDVRPDPMADWRAEAWASSLSRMRVMKPKVVLGKPAASKSAAVKLLSPSTKNLESNSSNVSAKLRICTQHHTTRTRNTTRHDTHTT
jgi:hypothetical protein